MTKGTGATMNKLDLKRLIRLFNLNNFQPFNSTNFNNKYLVLKLAPPEYKPSFKKLCIKLC